MFNFSNRTSENVGKFEFDHFLKSLECISFKLYPEFELYKSLQIILNNHILQLEIRINNNNSTESRSIQYLKDISENNSFVFYNFFYSLNIQKFNLIFLKKLNTKIILKLL